MKNPQIGKTFLNVTLVASAFLFGSCSNNKPEDTKDVAEEHNEAKFDERDKEKDAQFMVNAAEINLMEIQLGQLAQQSGTMTDIKDMGKMMEADHSKALNELKELASQKGITIPASLTEEGQDDYKKLVDQKPGKDFDKEFCDMMVKGHKDAIDKFEKASTDAADADIRAWAAATLPTLRTHLDHSMSCQEKAKNM